MAAQTDKSKLKVFLSYSRQDSSPLAEELLVALDVVGFDAFLDRHDIAAGEDWELRIRRLIESADTVVFLLSPEAVRSERCAWEVNTAVQLSKRILPVVASAVDDAAVPAQLRRLNYIFFNRDRSFARPLAELADALRVDLDWIRDHTRYGEQASRWAERERADALLLRGVEITAAQAWMASRKPDAPDITDLQRAFIAASADAEMARTNEERRRLEAVAAAQAAQAAALAEREQAVKTLGRRTFLGGIGLGSLGLASGAFGYVARRAEGRYRQERARADEAQQRSYEAQIQREALRTDIEGQLVAYAASPGQLAQDALAGGTNSPYTTFVLKELTDARSSLQVALARANRKVLDATGMSQRPYLASDLNGDVYLRQQPASRRRRAIVVSAGRLGQFNFPNVERDALLWEKFLKDCDFDVRWLKEPRAQQILDAVSDAAFPADGAGAAAGRAGPPPRAGVRAEAAAPNTCLLFFFAGAGIRLRGSEWLIASGTRLDSTDERLADTAIRVASLADRMRTGAAASLIVLDTAFPSWDRA